VSDRHTLAAKATPLFVCTAAAVQVFATILAMATEEVNSLLLTLSTHFA
jgi:hypothetical protein